MGMITFPLYNLWEKVSLVILAKPCTSLTFARIKNHQPHAHKLIVIQDSLQTEYFSLR